MFSSCLAPGSASICMSLPSIGGNGSLKLEGLIRLHIDLCGLEWMGVWNLRVSINCTSIKLCGFRWHNSFVVLEILLQLCSFVYVGLAIAATRLCVSVPTSTEYMEDRTVRGFKGQRRIETHSGRNVFPSSSRRARDLGKNKKQRDGQSPESKGPREEGGWWWWCYRRNGEIFREMMTERESIERDDRERNRRKQKERKGKNTEKDGPLSADLERRCMERQTESRCYWKV